MGTTGRLGFIINGEVRGALHNALDSNPIQLGNKIVQFILALSDENRKQMIKNLEKIEWVNAEFTPSPELQERYSKFLQDKGSPSSWSELLYKLQHGEVLCYILHGTIRHLPDEYDSESFWDYWLDFEEQTLETRCPGEGHIEEWVHKVGFADLKRRWAGEIKPACLDQVADGA